MRGVISGQLIISMVASLLFLVMYGHPGRYEDREMAWFLAALVWAGVLLDGLLLAAVFGARIPLWVAVGVLAGQDIVVGWRLWLLLRAHADRRGVMTIAKAVIGAVIAGLGTAATALADNSGITALEWVAIATTTLVALYGVWQVPNRSAP